MTDNLPTIFLGYPFALTYVRPAVERAAEGIARVVVASDILRGMPLLEKIEQMMSQARLCLFDLTTHNPNVATEFGIARGRGYAWAILYCTDETLNPKPGRESSVFSDVKGWDSILYGNEIELETELRRLLPEYLANLAQVRTGGNIGATAHHSPPAPVARAQRRDTPRLYLNVKTNLPGFIGVGSSPTQKLGSYSLILEIQNKGRGAANKVRAVMAGATHIERLGTLTPGDKPVRSPGHSKINRLTESRRNFPWSELSISTTTEPSTNRSEPFKQRSVPMERTYVGGNLEAPRAIEAATVPYGD